MVAEQGASATIEDVWFHSNTSDRNGGGAYIAGTEWDLTILASNFVENTSGHRVSSPTPTPIAGSGGGLNLEVDESIVLIGSTEKANMQIPTRFNANFAHGVSIVDSTPDNSSYTDRFMGGGGLFVNGTNNKLELNGVEANENEATFPGAVESFEIDGSVTPTAFTNGDGGLSLIHI